MHVFHTMLAVFDDDEDDDSDSDILDVDITWVRGRIILEHIAAYYPDAVRPQLLIIEMVDGRTWTARDKAERLDQAFRDASYMSVNRN